MTFLAIIAFVMMTHWIAYQLGTLKVIWHDRNNE